MQVFFAILLVGVSVGQALPHVQRLVAAETAARTLQTMIHRVCPWPTFSVHIVWNVPQMFCLCTKANNIPLSPHG